jgi:hypothetical protein
MPGVPILWSLLAAAVWLSPANATTTDKDKAELATAVSASKVTLE